MKRILATTAFSLGLAFQAAATVPYQIVEQWTAADGLPVDTIAGLAVDRDDQLWLATYDGVVRYQGFDFQHFNRDTEPGFPSNRLLALHAAPQGGVFLQFEDGRVGHLDDRGYQPVGRAEPGNVALFDQQVWFIDSDTETLWSWQPSTGPAQRDDRRISAMAVDLDGARLLLGTRSGRVLFLGIDEPELRTLLDVGSGPIVGLASGPDGELVVLEPMRARTFIVAEGVSDRSSALDLEQRQLQPVRAAWTPRGWLLANLATSSGVGPHILDGSSLQRLPVAEAISVSADRSPSRIERVDARGRRWINDGQQLLRDGKVVFRSEERIIDFVIDPFDQVWLAQPNRGLRLLKQVMIRTLGNSPGELEDPNISMVREYGGDILIGSWVELSRLNPETGEWSNLLQRAVRDVLSDDGGLLVGSNGLCRLESAGNCRNVADFPTETAEVLMLHRDAKAVVWAGTSSGLFRRAPDRRWDPEPVHPAITRTALEDASGRLLFGTNGDGILVLPSGRNDDHVGRRIGLEQGLPSSFIRSLLGVPEGGTLVGTEDAGLCLLNEILDVVGCIATDGGLPHHSVHYMILDDLNRLWVNSNGGIYRVDLKSLLAYLNGETTTTPDFYRYGKRHGLKSVEGNGGVYRAGALTRDGTIWFPNQRGLVAIRRVEESAMPGQPLTTRIRAIRQASDGPLHLTRNSRHLDLELTAVALAEPGNVQFRYRFDRDSAWTEIGHRRHLYFRDLDPGRHRLEASARHINTPWSGVPARMEFTVGYRLHEHPLFHTLLIISALLALAGLGLAVRNRQRRLEREIEDRSSRLDEATQQVSGLAQSLQRVDAQHRAALRAVSRELKSALNTAMEPLLRQRERSRKAKEYERTRTLTLSALIDQIGRFADPPAESSGETGPDSETPAAPTEQQEKHDEAPRSSVDLTALIRMEVLLHLSDPDFSVDGLARRLGISRSVLYRRVAESFDSRPAELMRDIRLEQAVKLLQETEDQVSTIAFATGFRSVSAFSKAFSKKMGVSPRQWRRRSQG